MPFPSFCTQRQHHVVSVLQHEAEVGARNKYDSTPLHLASHYGELEIARLLLDYGANVDAKKEDGRTPLHQASSRGKKGTVRLLLDHDAKIHAENKDGGTSLHLASSKGNTETVRLLLDRGASTDVKDREGRTPFQLASGEAIVQMLTEDSEQIERVLNAPVGASFGPHFPHICTLSLRRLVFESSVGVILRLAATPPQLEVLAYKLLAVNSSLFHFHFQSSSSSLSMAPARDEESHPGPDGWDRI
ncbi:ankyrin repeat-containing domain protein [Lactarius vividus]|nr:ankyrin repeat-containing domain protein [Lactarius vividus]